MCGIFGMLDPVRPLADSARAWAEQAQLRLQHRGPDGQQCVTLMNGRCLLGHLRLAIIDIEGGAQPISNEDGTIWVVCNGEIYNYLELREKLIAQGHRFSTTAIPKSWCICSRKREPRCSTIWRACMRSPSSTLAKSRSFSPATVLERSRSIGRLSA